MLCMLNKDLTRFLQSPSAETQRQIVGARECLNGQKNMEWREEPLGTMSYQTSSKRLSPFWLLIGAKKILCFCAQSEGRTAAIIWNWSGKTLSPGALLTIPYFSAHLDFLSPPLSASGSLQMDSARIE